MINPKKERKQHLKRLSEMGNALGNDLVYDTRNELSYLEKREKIKDIRALNYAIDILKMIK